MFTITERLVLFRDIHGKPSADNSDRFKAN